MSKARIANLEDKELMKKDCIRRKKHLEQGRLAAFPVKKSVNYLRTITSMRMTRKCEETAKWNEGPALGFFHGKLGWDLGSLKSFRCLRKITRLKFLICCGNFKVHYLPMANYSSLVSVENSDAQLVHDCNHLHGSLKRKIILCRRELWLKYKSLYRN